MYRSRRAATSIDVARAAGVSQSTVSRALRGDKSVSEATRRKIGEVAASLGYVPIDRGRNLSTRATRRIAMVSPDLTNQFYPELIEPMRSELDAAGYRAILVPLVQDDEQALRNLADGSVDGVVFMTTRIGDRLPYLVASHGIPTVLVNREFDRHDLDSSVVDNYEGSKLVADFLVSLGHRKIAAILGPADTSTARDGEYGFRAGLAEHGLALPSRSMVRDEFAHSTGVAGIGQLLDVAEPPTAVFCQNDLIAIGALNTLHRRGLHPGHDLTILGFDDISMASWDIFSLTTVHVDLDQLARSAVTLLLQRIADPSREPERVVTAPQLVLRGSHGPPRD